MGLGLRLSLNIIAPRLDAKVSGTIIGLWEGACLHYFTSKWKTSSDPYVAYAFRIFVDWIFTEDVLKLTVVMLWTGLGVLLADVAPGLWIDTGLDKVWLQAKKYNTVRRTAALWARSPNANGNVGSTRGVHFEPPPAVIVGSSVASTPVASGINLRNIPQSQNQSLFPPRTFLPGAYTDITSETGRSVAETILPVPIPSPAHLRDISEEENLMNDDGQTTPKQRATNLTFVDDFELEYMDDDDEAQPAFHRLLEIPEYKGAIPPEPQLVIPTFGPRPNIPPEPLPALPVIEMSPKEKRKLLPPIPDDDDAANAIVPREGIPPQPEISIPKFGVEDHEPIPPQPQITIPDINFSADVNPRPLSKALPELPEGEDDNGGVTVKSALKRRTLPPAYTDSDWEQVDLSEVNDEKIKADVSADDGGPSNRVSNETEVQSVGSDQETYSVISADGTSNIITKAELLRIQAIDEEKVAADLTMRSRDFKLRGLIREAFLTQAQADESRDLAKKLHEQAARRYFYANNRKLSARVIDVHGLKVSEAVRQTEKALRVVLAAGGSELRVVVSQGRQIYGKVPILKLALIRAMQGHGIAAIVDKVNPSLLVIKL